MNPPRASRRGATPAAAPAAGDAPDTHHGAARPDQADAGKGDLHAQLVGLTTGATVRREWPDGSRLRIQGTRPFLCVLRAADARPQLRELVAAQASYFVWPPARGPRQAPGLVPPRLESRVRQILEHQRRTFELVLLLEVWERDPPPALALPLEPNFRVVGGEQDAPELVSRSLRRALTSVRVGGLHADVEHVDDAAGVGVDDQATLRPLARSIPGVCWLGVEIFPVYRTGAGDFFPAVLAEIEVGFGRAVLHALADLCTAAGISVPSHLALGRTNVAEPDWVVDRKLAAVASSFDFVLALTPVNAKTAWQQFRRERFERAPELHYRPLTMDPEVCKRTLYNVPIEHVEDPTLVPLLREKQEELDRKITMLADRNTKNFLYESLQLYGAVSAGLHALARKLLNRLPAEGAAAQESLAGAEQMARAAYREIAAYRARDGRFLAGVEIRDDLAAGLMVSNGKLLISSHHRVPRGQLDAYMQHEVGTHLLTYNNARCQPFRQLVSGLAGYEALQEGLAVLSEYLVGGLTRHRLRVLAGRVIACEAVTRRADFVEVFRLLHREYGFGAEKAFNLVIRVWRGGGFTKDALYLRGLVQLLRHLGGGGLLERLFIGKLDLRHLPAIEELQLRSILVDPPLRPLYLEREEARSRLDGLRRGVTVLQLAKEAMA